MKYFSASLEGWAKVATAMPPFVIGIMLIMAYAPEGWAAAAPFNPLALLVPLVLLMAFGYAHSIRGYWVSRGELRVQRPFSTVTIPLTSAAMVRLGQPKDSAWMVKVFGSGGLFGYWGWYRTSGVGTAKWYATRRENLVVIETMGKKYVISPDDPEGLVAALDRTEENRWGGDQWA